MEYTKEWITLVRGKMNKIEFGDKIYQFKTKKNELSLYTVHRNTITNWELGKTALPRDVESFISLGIIAFNNEFPGVFDDDKYEVSLADRNKRYFYIKKLMNEMIGLDLYSRNLHDALLIQVCRGVLAFQDIIPFEKEMESKLEKVDLSREEKNEYAIERNTIFIDEDLLKVTDIIGVEEVIATYKETFASANRTIGARVSNVYNKRLREENDCTIAMAITNYAPNYRDSYLRMYTSSFISRNWLLDLCIHLRFNRDELEDILESAHMAPLDNDIRSIEGIIKNDLLPERTNAIGSVEWYINLDSLTNGRLGRYRDFVELEMIERLKIMLLIGAYLNAFIDSEGYEVEDLPPVDFILEAFGKYEYGIRGCKKIDELMNDEEIGEAYFEDVQDELGEIIDDSLGKYLESISLAENYDMKLSKSYKEETPHYYDSTDVLHYYAAICFTLFTGRYFVGEIKESDLQDIKSTFDGIKITDNPSRDMILGFVSQFIGGLLGANEKTKVRVFNMDGILDDIWESIMTFR